MQWVLSFLAVYHFVLTRKITQIFVTFVFTENPVKFFEEKIRENTTVSPCLAVDHFNLTYFFFQLENDYPM